MKRKKYFQYAFFLLYTTLFTLLIFVGKEIFFPSQKHAEQYLEPHLHDDNHSHEFHEDEAQEFASFSGVNQQEVESAIHSLIYEEFSKKYQDQKKNKIRLRYIPTSFQDDIRYSYTPIAQTFLYDPIFLEHIRDISVFFHQSRGNTRGKMKDGRIHMYGITQMKDDEFLGVLAHEFSHYFDIYALAGTAYGDVSQDFYDISWDGTTRMKPRSTSSDFVSGYALTNKYEDFAESYTFYMLHNREFLARAEKNEILKEKYDFLRRSVFPEDIFFEQDFSPENFQYQEYYWDSTKIPTDVKKFLQYLNPRI